ncbi:MAG TPA: hypothetical protein PKZ08_00550 [Vicinamibacterales bacterium]|nr:hypothetical protein [Vicinamibacterales bacterium]
MADAQTLDQARDTAPITGEMTQRSGSAGALQAANLEWGVRTTLRALKEMRADPQIALGLELVKAPIHGASYGLRAECEDARIAAFVQAEIERIWRGAVTTALTAVEFGFSAHEKVWRVDADGVHIAKLKDLDPAHCVLLQDENGDFGGLRWQPPSQPPVIVPAAKCFIFTHAKEFGNLYGRSRMSSAARHWQYGNNFMLLAGRCAERAAIVRYKGWAPQGQVQTADGRMADGIAEMHANLLALKAGGVISMPSDADAQGKRLWDAETIEDDLASMEWLLKLIEHCDTMKLRGMLVPDRVATQGDKGALAMAEAHIKTFLSLEDRLLFDLLDHLDRYLVTQLVRYNFGPDAPECHLKSDGLGEEAKARLYALVDKVLAQPITAQLAAEVLDVARILREGDVPLLDAPRRLPGSAYAPLSQEEARRAAAAGVGMQQFRAQRGSETTDSATGTDARSLWDERDAILARGMMEAQRHFDALIEGARKN